jgi:hypothetical protein
VAVTAHPARGLFVGSPQPRLVALSRSGSPAHVDLMSRR